MNSVGVDLRPLHGKIKREGGGEGRDKTRRVRRAVRQIVINLPLQAKLNSFKVY